MSWCIAARRELLIMNKLIFIFTAAAMGFTSFGAPLDKKNVAGDAQWLAHLDFENLKETKMGAFLLVRLREEIAKNNDSRISTFSQTVSSHRFF